MLTRAIEAYPAANRLDETDSLNDIRNYLLDLIDVTKETMGPDARARMIRLQARPTQEALLFRDLSNLIVEPVTIVSSPGMKSIILTHNPSLAEVLDSAPGLIEKFDGEGVYQTGGGGSCGITLPSTKGAGWYTTV